MKLVQYGVLSCIVWVSLVGVVMASTPEKLPWTLREHYTFSGGALRLDYAVDNAEWRIKLFEEDSETSRMQPDVLVRDVGFSVHLQDGRVITNYELGFAGESRLEREPFANEHLGDGVSYTVHFVPVDGLLVQHRLSTFRQWDFLLLSIRIQNIGENPATISSVTTANIVSGAISGFSETAQISTRPVSFRGPFPVYTGDESAGMMRFYNPDRNVSIAFGQVPAGRSAATSLLQQSAGLWQGYMRSDFAPGKTIAPGEHLETDPIWVSFGASPSRLDAQYAWVLQDACKLARLGSMPRAWVTVPDTEGISALRRQAEQAKSFGIGYALIPGNWESRPGSLEGGAPRYPKNIGDAARTLIDAGVIPGITVDPLLGMGGGEGWTTRSADGQTWVNPAVDEGRAFAIGRLRRLITAGFSFLVIDSSTIPDEALHAFNMTRAEADTAALAVAVEAASGSSAVVAPAAVAELGPNRNGWLEAVASVGRLLEYSIAVSPVRLRIGTSGVMDDETMIALRFWRGPVEFLGAPPQSVQTTLAQALRLPSLSARPHDAAERSPLLWLVRVNSPALGYTGATMFAFPGAPAYDLSSIEVFGGESTPSMLWHPQADKAIEVQGNQVEGAGRMTTHGLLSDVLQPMFAGMAGDVTLGLDRIKRLEWHAERGVLTGQIEGPMQAPATAFFLSPRSLRLHAAKVNSRQVRPTVEGHWISLPMDAAGGAFELEFHVR